MNVQTQPDLTEFGYALLAAIFSAHQNRERIVGCARAGGRVECPQAVGRVSAGLPVWDRRCTEDWESLRARPCQMRRAVLFPNPFCTPQLNRESKLNCYVTPSRIPRSMIGVDENLCGRSPSGAEWRYCVCDVSTVRLVLLALGAAVYARGKYGVVQNVCHNLASTNGVYGYVGRTRPTPA